MVLGVYGASGLGTEYENLAEIINEESNCWDEIIFVDDGEEKIGTTLVDLPIMSFKQAIEKYGVDGIEFILAIGEPAVKDIVFNKVCESGAKVTNLIHPDIRVPRSFTCEKGIVVHGMSGLPTCSHFGNNVLIQGKAVMGHNLELGDNVVISSLAFVGGDVTVGRNTYIAPGSCIRNGLNIGKNVIDC